MAYRTYLERATIEATLWTLFALEMLALVSVPSVLLRRRGRPSAALAWLLTLLALPAVGVLAWWAFGRTRLERKLRPHVERKRDYLELQGAPENTRKTRFDDMLPLRARGEYTFATPHNAVSLLLDGEAAFTALHAELGRAQNCIHLIFYIFRLDETGRALCRLLIEKREQGVPVRLLVDGFGSQDTAGELKRLLSPAGIEVGVFLPSRLRPLHAPRLNFINHRKIVVIDNRVAFSGGMNIGDEYRHSWRDVMIRVEGPAVAGLNHIFLEDWYFSTQQAIADPDREAHEPTSGGSDIAVISSGPDSEPWIHDAYFLAFTRAERRLYIATPYFIPTTALLTALRTAAGRGVDVHLIVPHFSDVKIVRWASRSYYQTLVEAGVRIFEYQGPMLHAKALVMDDLCSVGTANIDPRSMRLNFEVCCFVQDARMTEELRAWLEDLSHTSVEMTQARLAKVGLAQSLLESAAHVMSPLL